MEQPERELLPPGPMSWTLARDGRYMTCRLLQPEPGEYVLRLKYENVQFLDIRCSGPHEALSRSLETLGSLFQHGWRQRVCPE